MDDTIPEADRIDGVPHPRETVHLFGQENASAAFLDAFVADRVHHGWLITGPRGVGKATLGWRIARLMLSGRAHSGKSDPDLMQFSPDDVVFRKLSALGDPRLALVRRPWDPDRKKLKANITVDEVRKLNGFFHLSAADGGWRVAIVDAADEMNAAAANALLKILEEPPERTILLLISHQPGRLLPTIKSRCRTLACEKLSPENMALALDGAGFSAQDVDVAALGQLADGSVGDALELVQQEGQELYAQIVNTLASLPRLDRGDVLQLADAAATRGADAKFALTLRLVQLALSRLAKSGATGDIPAEAASGEAAMLAKLAPHADAGRQWAELAQILAARSGHAVSVNLDPAGVILDTFLQIEATATRIGI